MAGLIQGGRIVPVVTPLEVVDGRQEGLWFDPGDPNTSAREQPADLIVWHHQAGLGNAKSVHRVLKKRRLSVHFQIDLAGVVTQLADLSTVCAHVGKVNDRSVGVEIASYGLAKLPRRVLAKIRRRHDFYTYQDALHGRKLQFFRLLPAQVAAAYDLAVALSAALEIPYRFPLEIRPPAGAPDRVVRETLSDEALRDFRGHIAHYHVSPHKVGVTPHLMDDLAFRASRAS